MLLLLVACHSEPVVLTPPPVDSAGAETVPPDTARSWEACADTPVRINELVAANQHGLTDAAGDNPDWIELAAVDAPVDLTGWALADDSRVPWALPAVTLTPGAPLLVYASGEDRVDTEVHAAFSLDAFGDEVFLYAPDGCVDDHVDTGRLYADVAYGRASDGAWEYFLDATPGADNTTESRPGFADPPTVSPAPGVHAAPVEVTVSGGGVTCTLDGSVPTDASTPCDTFTLDASADAVVVRARAFADGLWPSRITTATYLQDPTLLDSGIQVISLVVDPPDLWDEESGIYAYGTDYEPSYPYFGANFWQVWERDLHVEIFAADGTTTVAQDAGIQIAGGWSRAFDQRNFELIPRSGYGPETFDGRLFAQEDNDTWHRLYLRNGGDWCGTQLVDASVQALFRDPDPTVGRDEAVDAQAYEPVLVYLNGEFWGVYELKERLDEWWVADHRGEDPEALDRVKLGWTHEPHWTLDQGTWDAFETLNGWIGSPSLADAAGYAAFREQVDVENFATTFVVEGWMGSTDFWSNNLRLWRPTRPGGLWRWMAYDFGHGWPAVTNDHLATTVSGDWTGLPIHTALTNPDFRALFANVHADYLNTSLASARAEATVTALADQLRPAMPRQLARWCTGVTMGTWESEIAYAESYAAARPAVIDAQLVQHLGLSGHVALALDTDPPGSGRFHLSAVRVGAPYTGTYYADQPMTVTAEAEPGWVFEGWSDGSSTAAVTLPMAGDTSLVARFVEE